MTPTRLEFDQLPDYIVAAIRDRDAALWIDVNQTSGTNWVTAASKIIGLPWRIVLCESSDAQLLKAVEHPISIESDFSKERGFVHLVASDPDGIELPPRALPILLLNGRSDAADKNEAVVIGGFAKLRRRLNMMKLLVAKTPRVLVIISDGEEQPIADFVALWRDEGFRCRVALVSSSPEDEKQIDGLLALPLGPAAVDQCKVPLDFIADNLNARIRASISADRFYIRIRDVGSGNSVDRDITGCDLVERPLLDSYELIPGGELRLIQPHELARAELETFFTRSEASWRPYAAGLPWNRDAEGRQLLLAALRKVAHEGPEHNRILGIVAESGAGGTTFARSLAFAAAVDGYPSLIARVGAADFSALELSRFLYAVHSKSADAALHKPGINNDGSRTETPWLVVFDVAHWEGREIELRHFLNALKSDGRSVVILVVKSPNSAADLGKSAGYKQLAYLTHEMEESEAVQLGEHLNKYLRVHGREHSSAEWRSFWEAHRPDYLTHRVAHFWVALDFWLKGQLGFAQSLQQWLYDSFKSAAISNELRVVVLEIAALSIERQPIPEGLIPLLKEERLPATYLLERLRHDVPGLALVREMVGEQRLWAIAHDLLARYLLNSTFFDRGMLESLGLADAKDPVRLRLRLLRRVATRSDLALKVYRNLALDFAIKILKLDADGNQEFVGYWRDVLEILGSIPAGVRQTSRAFNHHVAISLRRAVKQREFEITGPERQRLLEQAVRHLEYALTDLPDANADESRLNLYNSLALAYQDLADVQREQNAPSSIIERLRTLASDATRRALEQDPSNSYVLETTAKNLIQQGELYKDQALACATEALAYVYQALSLDRSYGRQAELTRLANRAISLLRSAGNVSGMRKLADQGNPLGSLAEAWTVLLEGADGFEMHDFALFPPQKLRSAITVLDNSAFKSDWMVLRLRYDLISALEPNGFEEQLRILDELEGTKYLMPQQLKLEHAILLHQNGRHFEGNRNFLALRRELKRSDAVVEVPNRLFWLKSTVDGTKLRCDAQVSEARGLRANATVREFLNESVPFVPQEFGQRDMRPGTRFKCLVNFGRLGPFLKPPTSD
jgi:hypothetical protein